MTAKVGIVEEEEVLIAGQEHYKRVSAAADSDATIKNDVLSMWALVETALLTRFRTNDSLATVHGEVFSAWSAPRLYGEDEHGKKQ
jgi:hypothetical protein